MATDFTIKQDDRLPEIQGTLMDSQVPPQVVNLTSCSVRFIMTNKVTGEKKVDQPATIVDASNGVVKYAWAAIDTDEAGSYNAEFEVKFPDDRLETFPNDRYIQIKVKADLGGVDGTPA
jgi:hypothetical protein